MNRIRRHGRRTTRQWLGLCLVLLLAFAPPFNLAGADLALDRADRHAEGGHGDADHDHSGLAHHTSDNSCLQCLVMGGMSLAGASAAPPAAPKRYAIGPGWVLTAPAWDSRATRILVCRGPPALA